MRKARVLGGFNFLKIFVAGLILSGLLTGCSLSRSGAEPKWLVLLTTAELDQSGLLDVILPPYEKSAGVRIKRLPLSTQTSLNYAALAGIDVVLLPGGTALDKLSGPQPTFAPFRPELYPTPTPHTTPAEPEEALAYNFLYYERKLAFWSKLVLLAPADSQLAIQPYSDVANTLKTLYLTNLPIYAPTSPAEPGLYDLGERLWRLIGRFEPKDRGTGYKQVEGDFLTVLKKAATDKAYIIAPLAVYLKAQSDPAIAGKFKIAIAEDNTLYLPYELAIPNNVPTQDRDVVAARALAQYLRGQSVQASLADFRLANSKEVIFKPHYFAAYVPPLK